jgi:hypothetical protein
VVQIFKKANFETECDACHKPFSVSTGGVCERCRRILCNDHLHGSLARRIAIGFGAPMICVRCRAEATSGHSDS